MAKLACVMDRHELRRLRKQAGLTQQELADLLGVNRLTVWRWESGRVPIDTALEIAILTVLAQILDKPS